MSRAGRPYGDAARPGFVAPAADPQAPYVDADDVEMVRALARRDRRRAVLQFLMGIVLISLAFYSHARGSAWIVSLLFAVVAVADLLLAVRQLRRSTSHLA